MPYASPLLAHLLWLPTTQGSVSMTISVAGFLLVLGGLAIPGHPHPRLLWPGVGLVVLAWLADYGLGI